VHPDLFEGHKEEQRVNTESLKELHKAVERLTDCHSAESVELNFYYREKDVSNGTFQFVSVQLTDSLVPLYEAFGVISPEEAAELRSHESQDARNLDDTNFLQWLEATIQVRGPISQKVIHFQRYNEVAHVKHVIDCGRVEGGLRGKDGIAN
jgi:hypothetical protein